MRGENSLDNERGRGLLTEAMEVLRGNLLLVLGSIAWWGSHYLLLWNARIAAVDSLISGYDGRFVLTIAGTVIALGIATLVSRRKPQFTFAGWRGSYVVFAVCASVALGLLVIPALGESNPMVTAGGAVLSGVGNSFMLLLCGELHARMGVRFMPLAFAVETVAGVAVFFLLSWLPVVGEMATSAVLIVIAAVSYYAYARSARPTYADRVPAKVDMTVKPLVVLAVLTGFAYGLVRTFAAGGLEHSGTSAGMESEYIGTCICALLLVAVFLLQGRQSLFEQCLLFVVPLVATGMLLVSLHGVIDVVPTAINTGGFACFFNLMWYFAAVLAVHDKKYRLTFLVALLFFSSQLGQMLGALVPTQFSNAFSSGLTYLLLLVSTLFMYYRAKTAQKNLGKDGMSEDPFSIEGEECLEDSAVDAWIQRFGFSAREAQIAMLLARRMPYKQISAGLFISDNTVKTHVRNIYKKADVSSREELVEALRDIAKNG